MCLIYTDLYYRLPRKKTASSMAGLTGILLKSGQDAFKVESSSSFISAGQLFQLHRSTSGGFRVGGP